MTDGPLYVVTLRPVRDPVHPHRPRAVPIRLRAFLKLALRIFGLKAVDVAEVVNDEPRNRFQAGARNDSGQAQS